MHIAFEHPYFLFLLPLALCLIYCKKIQHKSFLPKLEWIPKKNRLFNYQSILKVAIFLLLTIAISSPIRYDAITPSKKYGHDIVLALDTSGSMKESGFSKTASDLSKFALLQKLVADFIDKRMSDNIGIVAFGSFAFTASPVTYDHQGLKNLLDMLEVEIAGKNTAIGDAIEQSITTLSYAKAKEKVIILITDGINNAGHISIKDAISKAKEKGIKIFTIGLGTTKEYDAKLLKRIAGESLGKSFGASDAAALQKVYDEIDHLLPSAIRSEQYLNKRALFYPLLLLASLLFVGLLALRKGIV